MGNKYLVSAYPGRVAGYVCGRKSFFVEADDSNAALTIAGAQLVREMMDTGRRTYEKAIAELGTLDWKSEYRER